MAMELQSSGDITADRRLDYARQFAQRGEMDAAIDLARQALEIAPGWAAGWFALGEMLFKSGADGAAEALNRYLTLDPADRHGAAVKLALLGATAQPHQLPDAYIAALFDQYAPRFDSALVEKLQYRAPQRIAGLLTRFGVWGMHVLDLGCGTGLMAEALPFPCARIDGVDLSAGMIAEAEGKKCYAALHVGEITEWLQDCADRYDLVLAADVLTYLGDLVPVMRATVGILEAGGHFCFTTQRAEGDFVLGADHRYGHGEDYLRRAAAGTGFTVVALDSCVLRQDAGRDVAGWVCLAKKK